MRLIKNTSKRVLALVISVLMIISMLPVSVFSVFALSDTALTTDIAEKMFFTEQATEFTFTTKAGAFAGEMVLGSFTLLTEGGADAQSAVKKLEYWDVTAGEYREFYGDFGPAATGFPLTDATSNFRVTFLQPGNYTVKASMVRFADRSVVVSADDKVITVKPHQSELTTDIGTKTFINNTEVEFTYTTVPNAQAGTMVLGTFSVVDSESNDAQSCIKKLEYWDVTAGEYREFYGDFGPAATGFPLIDATSKFRVTFNTAGTYTVNAAMKKFGTGEIICSDSKTITVQTNKSLLTTNITEKAFEVNETVEFEYTTKANDFLNTMVLGKFILKKDGVEVDPDTLKLEYWDVTAGEYREFYGNFGPAATGFPLTDATSKFRVNFEQTGEYTVVAQMVTFVGDTVLSENTSTIEVKDTKKPVISEITGNATVWTNSDVVLEVVATDNSGAVAQYRMDDGAWQTSNKFTITENGKHKFYAKDAAGNESVVSDEIDVTFIDKTAPVIGIITLNPDNWTNTAVTVTVPATDVGINEILYKMDDGAWQTSNEFSIADNNTHKFYVKDSLGNENTVATEIVADKYDATAPVIDSLTPSATDWVVDQVVITVNATDAGVQGIAYKLDNGEWQSTNTFTVTENGTYKIYVRDALKNFNATASEITVDNIDKVIPEIKDLTSTTEDWTNQDVVISGTVADTQSGVAKLQYKIGNDIWQDLAFDAQGKFVITVSNECDTTYTFKCIDTVGNESAEYTKTVKVDKTPASLTVNPVSDTWKNNQITVFGTVSDLASGIKSATYTNNNGDSGNLDINGSDYSFNTNVAASGEYTYVITVVDNAGNIQTVNSDVVKIDLVDPVTSVTPADSWTNQSVTVVVTATDANAGIEKVFYKKNGGAAVEVGIIDGFYKFVIPNAANDTAQYEIYSIDNSGRQSASVYYNAKIDVIAPSKPTITYSTAIVYRIIENVTFGLYKAPVNVVIESTDDLSGLKSIKYYLNDAETVVTPDNNGKITFTIPANNQLKISAIAVDNAGNDSNKENAGSDDVNSFGGVVVDDIKPVVDEIKADVVTWTNGQVVISGKVSDNLSGVEKVLFLKGDSVTPEEVQSFNKLTGEYSFTVQPQSYNGKYHVYCVDYSTNESDKVSVTVKMDNKAPAVDTASADITTWTKNTIVVTGKVSDDLSTPASVYWRQGNDQTQNPATLNSDGTYSFDISPRDFKGNIYIGCYDVTGNKSDEKYVEVKMDNTKPEVEEVKASTSDWTNTDVVITGKVSDAVVNNVTSEVVSVICKYNGQEYTATYNENDGTYKYVIPATNYNGKVEVWCIDNAGNVSDVEYTTVRMDITNPQVVTGTAVSADWTNEMVTVSGTVTDVMDSNADADEEKTAISNVEKVEFKYDNVVYQNVNTFDGTNYSCEIPARDYKGNVTIRCYDFAGNVSDEFNVAVKMDVSDPENVEIKYSQSIFSKILNSITFGFYNADKLTVTISATDNLALNQIKYVAEGEIGEHDSTKKELGSTIQVTPTGYNSENDVVAGYITFEIPAEYKGNISAVAYDFAGNSTAVNVNDKGYDEVIVDSIAPTIDVKYEAVKKEETKLHFVDENSADVEKFETATQALYNGDVTTTITITENNFFEGYEGENNEVVHEVGILVTKTDDDGVVTKTEYLPEGSANLFDDVDNTIAIDWTTVGNVHTYPITYAQDGDYVITIKYTDYSQNASDITANDGIAAQATYISKIVTVDKTAPVITVEYGNKDVKATYGVRDYFTANQSATITVKEHNFRADDFKAVIKAVYSDGTDVQVADFAAILSDDSKWTKDGNVYTIRLDYTVDANYTFDYTYEDLAHNFASEYTEDEFTVDKQDPHTPTVKYDGNVKTTILDKVLNVITFGYYDAKVKVTVTAKDDVSGIDHFVYSYIKGENVSEVNASLENVTIESENITQDGNTFTAKFEIPKDILQNTNQFNGTVKFTSFDRSTRNSEHKETATIVVDNIAPTATITYNEPIQFANDISYYADNIDATIVINEANFYAEDVDVKVNGEDVAVNWVNNSVDVHTGTFTIVEDGDYIVTVEYKDRSDNKLDLYTSNRLTIDRKTPEVYVSDVENYSANDNKKFGFTISAYDINIDASTFKPTLTAVVRDENGAFDTINVSLGDMQMIEEGKNYSFTVDNLERDAIYKLICTVEDMSDNKFEKVILKDGKEYDAVQFSINRDGSTYDVDEYTAKLIENYYVQNVTNNVVIHEVNVDTLKEFKVTLNGKDLEKDTDYTVTENGGGESWMRYTYSINESLFKDEGEYNVVVSSKDKADNDAFSDVKGATVKFVVDRTAPIVTITGMAENGRYQTESQPVTLIPTDDGGALNKLIVNLVNGDGKVIREIKNLSGADLEKALEEGSGKIKFNIDQGLYQNIQVICSDCAVDEKGNTNTYMKTVTNVSVDPNAFIVNFWANKPLRWGSIAGVLLLSAAAVFLVIMKKRKIAVKPETK